MEVSCQLHAPAALLLGKELSMPKNRSLGGPQSRSWNIGVKGKVPAPIGNRTLVDKSVAICHTDWTVPAHVV
jgi:hypothetical protein